MSWNKKYITGHKETSWWGSVFLRPAAIPTDRPEFCRLSGHNQTEVLGPNILECLANLGVFSGFRVFMTIGDN